MNLIFHYKGYDRIKHQFVIDVRNGNPVCDFCNDSSIIGYFQKKANCVIQEFEGEESILKVTDEDGVWAACTKCKKFVEENKMWELAGRAAKRLYHLKDNKMSYDGVLAAVLVAHGSFWNDR